MPAPLQLLTDLAREFQKRLSFDELLQCIVDGSAALLQTSDASIRLLAPDSDRLMAIGRAGQPLHLAPDDPLPLGQGPDDWVLQHGRPLRTGAHDQDARLASSMSDSAEFASFVAVPLLAEDTVLAVLSASHAQPDYFSERHEQLFTLLASIATPYIEIARRDFAIRDPLTGLFNHAHFQHALDRELERSASSALPFSLVLVDIDDFRPLNDTRGYQVGDALLVALAELIMDRSHAEKGFRLRPNDLVARYGPDSLALILPHTPKASAEVKGDLLREQVEQHTFGHLDAPELTVSVGVAAVPDDASNRADLIAAAERAVRTAKRCGKNTTIGHSRALAVASALESSLTVDFNRIVALERVIEEKQFSFVYQPIVDSESHRPIAYEALCRPTAREFAGPAELFETAEYAARVADLGRACRTISAKPLAMLPPDCLLFINLHPRELDVSLMQEVAIERWASRVVLEITETGAIEDYERTRNVIAQLRQHGFRIALDDLGAGYAGLNSLAQLQPDFVKLDMGLVRRIHAKSSTRRLVKHILEYCAAENIPVISEGVETEQEHDMVRSIGCPFMQGDYLARPGPAFPDLAIAREVS